MPIFEGHPADATGLGLTVYDVSGISRWRKLGSLHAVNYYTRWNGIR